MEDTLAKSLKRKDIMANIKSRVSADVYNAKNEKELLAKVKYFNKQEAEGKMKNYLRPRKEEAMTLLTRVQGLKSTPAAAAAAPAPAPKPKKKAAFASSAPAVPAAPAAAAKELLESLETPAAPAAAPAPARTLKQTLSEATASKKKEFKKLTVINEGENNSELSNTNFLIEASQKALPLPVFYDPYTGRKFHPDESPMTPIERAYKQLKKLRANVTKNAKKLKNKYLASKKTRKARRS
jgi:hypothetical protein